MQKSIFIRSYYSLKDTCINSVVVTGLLFSLLVSVFMPIHVLAASSFSDHVWQFANSSSSNWISFNKGGSFIFDDTHLHVRTDDYLYLDGPTLTRVSNNFEAGSNVNIIGNNTVGQNLVVQGNSTINGNSTVQGDSVVQGNSSVTGSVTANTYYGDGSNLTGISYTGGNTFSGLNITNNNFIELGSGAFTQFDYSLGSRNWEQYVNGSNFTLYNSNSNQDVMSVTENGDLTLAGGLTAAGSIDFHTASSFRAPVASTVLVDNTTVCSTTGLITFSTNDSHFYGCDGAHWQILDN